MRRGAHGARSRLAAAGIAGALAFVLGACTGALRSGLSELEADALVLALDDHAIAATKEPSRGRATFEVRVARGELPAALRVLESRGQLAHRQPDMDAVYGSPSLVPTPLEEATRRAAALAGELARTLEALPGVARARVHLTPPAPRAALDAPAETWRASVLVQRAAGEGPLDEAALRALLGGAVAPLPAEHIAIVQRESRAPRPAAWARVGPFTVAQRDAPRLRAALAGALALNALLAALLIALVARRPSRP